MFTSACKRPLLSLVLWDLPGRTRSQAWRSNYFRFSSRKEITVCQLLRTYPQGDGEDSSGWQLIENNGGFSRSPGAGCSLFVENRHRRTRGSALHDIHSR